MKRIKGWVRDTDDNHILMNLWMLCNNEQRDKCVEYEYCRKHQRDAQCLATPGSDYKLCHEFFVI